MDARQINEEYRKLNEMDVDQSFKDYITTHRQEQRDSMKGELERHKQWAESPNASEWDKKRYQGTLRKFKGKQDVDHIFKELYDKLGVDIQNAKIKEISVPAKAYDLKKVANEHTAILLQANKKIVVVLGGSGSKGMSAWAKWTYSSDKAITSVINDGWTRLDLSNMNSLSRAINKGLFQAAWSLDADSTLDLRNKRSEDRKGSIERSQDKYNYDLDKSGYTKRKLTRELGALKQDAFKADVESYKQKSSELKSMLQQQIKSSENELDLETLGTIIRKLQGMAQYNPDRYWNASDSKYQNAEKENMKQNVEELEELIRKL